MPACDGEEGRAVGDGVVAGRLVEGRPRGGPYCAGAAWRAPPGGAGPSRFGMTRREGADVDWPITVATVGHVIAPITVLDQTIDCQNLILAMRLSLAFPALRARADPIYGLGAEDFHRIPLMEWREFSNSRREDPDRFVDVAHRAGDWSDRCSLVSLTHRC